MVVAVHQPQYLPWLGYFNKIDRADIFVLLDNVQFKKNEWQNRNKIKTAQGWQWLTVPVRYKYPQLINEVAINTSVKWQHKQRQSILTNYKKSPYYHNLDEFLEEIFASHWEMISQLNIAVIRRLVALLGIDTPLFVASELGELPHDADERLVAITEYFGADTYLAGSGGSQYMDLQKYANSGIKVIFQDYKHPEYNQLFQEFEPYMSVIDLVLNHGDKSLSILRGNK
ncbi:MAG: WbqC family protein [Deltaproteobacteria bacterium]|nr:WbqC family protein [Deltaproteobacteria bacterium]MBW1737651.1 WbqC family protein [Deltaproteobacteria bacterium]MBW1908183.1 WbqC family protein [Deltaproteobacteria bacterium]MBW2032864.1 WbqC family protein [Deltaproteobacteria bacterium]MBW2114692.1 WbqC family protein [Deltaproteobacteria bacterium]